jgi:hypothetical protein
MPFGADDYLIASVAAPIITGFIGNILSGGDRDRAMQAYQDAFNIIQQMGAPPDLARKILLDKFEQVGVLEPELEEAINLEASKVAQIKESPTTKQAQLTALNLLKQRATGGMSPEFRADLMQIALQQARDTEAKRQQIIQNYQQRGLGGAGAELVSQVQGAAAGSAQAAEQSLQAQAQASRDSLEAISQYGRLGGDIRQQNFNVANVMAQAQDQNAIERFKEATRRQTQNVGARNLAQQQNLAARQRIRDQNVAMTNQERIRQRDAEAQMYNMGLNRAQILAGSQMNMGNVYGQQGSRTAGQWAQGGAAVGQGFGQYSQYLQNQDELDLLKRIYKVPSKPEQIG